MKMIVLVLLTISSVLSFADSNAGTKGALVLQLTGDSGSSISELNKKLKKSGISDQIPSSVEITSEMKGVEISKIFNELSDLASQANEYEQITTSAYGEKINGKYSCFTGDNTKIASIYERLVDGVVSDQFYIMAVSTKDQNRVGILYDESDSGSEGTWININRCVE